MPEANLLITYDPAHAKKAEDEVRYLLKSAGENAKFLESKVEGIFLLHTKKDPREITVHLNKSGKADKSIFSCTYRWIPIDEWVKTSVESIGKVLTSFDKKMDPEKSWKLDVSRRHFDKFSTSELIMKFTERIDKPEVDLHNPDVIIKIEILGDKTGCSLLDAKEIVDTAKMKS